MTKKRQPIEHGVISAEEVEDIAPIFKGKRGKIRFNAAAAFTGVNNVNRTHDKLVQAGVEPGPDFAKAILDDIGVDFLINGAEHLAEMISGPFITISNHIYGHLDGICLVDIIGHVRSGAKVMVNGILSRIQGLSPNFISVNPTLNERKVTQQNINGIKKCLGQVRSGEPLCLFPSGAVADYKPKEKIITERDWQDDAVRLIKKAHVPVYPIHFLDRNSKFYYALGLINFKVRLARLCHELYNKRGETPRVVIGAPISVEEQDSFNDIGEFKDFLRSSVYSLQDTGDFVRRSELVFP